MKDLIEAIAAGGRRLWGTRAVGVGALTLCLTGALLTQLSLALAGRALTHWLDGEFGSQAPRALALAALLGGSLAGLTGALGRALLLDRLVYGDEVPRPRGSRMVRAANTAPSLIALAALELSLLLTLAGGAMIVSMQLAGSRHLPPVAVCALVGTVASPCLLVAGLSTLLCRSSLLFTVDGERPGLALMRAAEALRERPVLPALVTALFGGGRLLAMVTGLVAARALPSHAELLLIAGAALQVALLFLGDASLAELLAKTAPLQERTATERLVDADGGGSTAFEPRLPDPH